MVVVVPVPVIPPGFTVQVPAGSPVSTTLPVAVEQEGWVMTPIVGAVGAPGAALTVNTVEAETQAVDVSFTSMG